MLGKIPGDVVVDDAGGVPGSLERLFERSGADRDDTARTAPGMEIDQPGSGRLLVIG